MYPMTLNFQTYLKKMDQIPAKCLRNSAEVLDFLLRKIITLSIKLSTFSEECKIAKLKPIFKKGAKTDFTFGTNIKNNWKINSLLHWRLPW